MTQQQAKLTKLERQAAEAAADELDRRLSATADALVEVLEAHITDRALTDRIQQELADRLQADYRGVSSDRRSAGMAYAQGGDSSLLPFVDGLSDKLSSALGKHVSEAGLREIVLRRWRGRVAAGGHSLPRVQIVPGTAV